MSKYKVTLNQDYSWPEPLSELPLKIHPSMDGKLDPEYVKFFNEVLCNRPDILETHKYPVEVTKKGGNVIPGQRPSKEMSKIFDITIPRMHTEGEPIPARVFIPKGTPPSDGWPCMIWYHGGGWVLGGLHTENSYCTYLAEDAKCLVISIDYRLAPEFPYPACVDDSFEALLFIMYGPKDLDIDTTKVGLGGCSAGGNLSAIMTHKYASSPLSKGLPPLRIQLLIVPVIDNSATAETYVSWKENKFTPQLPADKMMWYRQTYLPEAGSTLVEPESSPIYYPDSSFKLVPPAYLGVAECDVLRSEAEAYHEKLIANGIESKLEILKGVPHTVMIMNERLKQGDQLVENSISAVKAAFS